MADVTLREGLPVMTPERTVADLVAPGQDLALVANTLADDPSPRSRSTHYSLASFLVSRARDWLKKSAEGFEEVMVSVTASEARRTLFPLIQQVNDDRVAVEIVSRAGNAVLMPADEYAAWQETAYLFRSPANARRLLDAYESARTGHTATHDLDRE